MVPIEIRKENRNRYFSRTSIIICRKFIVAIAYSIRIKLARGKWRTSSYELNNAHEQLKMLQKHLSHVWRTPWKSIQEIIILSGPLDIFKPQAITSHVSSADYFRLWPVSVKALTSMRYSSLYGRKSYNKNRNNFTPYPGCPRFFFFLSFLSFFQLVIHAGLKQPTEKKNSGTLPNGDPHDIFCRTCSYFENGPLATGLKNLKIQPKSQHNIWSFSGISLKAQPERGSFFVLEVCDG